MNRKTLLIGLPVALLLLLAAATAFLLPEDTESDSIIGRSDTQSEAESGKSGRKSPDACSSSSSDGGDNSKADAAGSGSKTPKEGTGVESERVEETAPELEVEHSKRPDGAATAQPERPLEIEPALGSISLGPEPNRPNPLLVKGKAKHQNSGNRRPRSHKISKGAGVKKLKVVSAKLKQDRRGLLAKYYRFHTDPIRVLANQEETELDERTPEILRIDRQVSFPNKEAWDDLPFDKSNFMAVWTGFLVIKKAADYWLFLGCDLHGRVELDGQTILLNQVRDYSEVTTVVKLKPGLHPLRIEYVESENGSVVEELGSCNFMWVPEGKSKPEPVPAKMLLLPEELWSPDAPTITRLSKNSAGIGHEITIYGQGLAETKEQKDDKYASVDIEVTFAGQVAKVISATPNKVVVRVPIGAKTGRLQITKTLFRHIYTQMPSPPALEGKPTFNPYPQRLPQGSIPSNSIDFTITNQFGLIANWHNLEGWSHFDFIEPGVREPEVTQLENPPTFESREDLNLEFKQNPMACTWTGKIGFPANWIAEGKYSKVRFEAHGSIRVRFGGIEKTAQASDSGEPVYVDFDVESDAGYISLLIDFTNSGGPASMEVYYLENIGHEFPDGDDGIKGVVVWETTEKVLPHWFFPPVVPDTLPTISNIHAVIDENEEPLELPYAQDESVTSIREGQECKMFVRVNSIYYSKTDMKSAVITIDSKRVEYEFVGERRSSPGRKTYQYNFTMPTGLGEGRVHIRANVLTSPPFVVDIQNKGLIAYYYDLPNAGGYKSMPDLESLACFAIRKDSWINFENVNDFNLPFLAETFAIQWLGAIIIEEEGFYTFTTRSDDGSKVWLDGNVVVDANNLQYQRERSGKPVFLAAGTYTFKMEFFENNGLETCELMWQAKDNQDNIIIEKQTVPKRAFTWDEHPALPNKQATGKRTDGSDPE